MLLLVSLLLLLLISAGFECRYLLVLVVLNVTLLLFSGGSNLPAGSGGSQ